jgi:proline iminopeptidase
VHGARLWYESEGQGPALVLVAGGPGSSHEYFHPYFTPLAAHYRVVYFDAFGRGKSDKAAKPSEYSFARDVDDLEGLRAALKLGRISVFGHSYGGAQFRGHAGSRRRPGAFCAGFLP